MTALIALPFLYCLSRNFYAIHSSSDLSPNSIRMLIFLGQLALSLFSELGSVLTGARGKQLPKNMFYCSQFPGFSIKSWVFPKNCLVLQPLLVLPPVQPKISLVLHFFKSFRQFLQLFHKFSDEFSLIFGVTLLSFPYIFLIKPFSAHFQRPTNDIQFFFM